MIRYSGPSLLFQESHAACSLGEASRLWKEIQCPESSEWGAGFRVKNMVNKR